jgi:hypothetical protein
MKKYFFALLLATVLFTVNGTAQLSLEGTNWIFTETQGNAITFEIEFKAGGTANYKQTNGPISGVLNWSGTPNSVALEGAFGTGSSIKMNGNMAKGKLSYSLPWSSNGKSGVQTGDYGVKLSKMDNTKWFFVETKMAAILMTVTFETGGKATYKQTNGPNAGTFTWSGSPDNLIVEGAFGSGTIKMTGNATTGKLNYVSSSQTGIYRISSKTNCTACNTNYAEKEATAWSEDDRNTAIWLLTTLSGLDVYTMQTYYDNNKLKGLINDLCLGKADKD